MRALVFDPFAGIAGDMTLAALLDLGLDEDWLRGFIRDLDLGDVAFRSERVQRRGIAARHVRFEYATAHVHRHLRHVLEIIDGSSAEPRAQQLASDAFRSIAEAEARIHGTTPEKVHFHEVGALDAILDVLCVMAAVTRMGYTDFYTRPVAVGSGWVDIEHGRYPVPAPATLGILRGITVTGTDLAGECTTPTGAAILATLTGGRACPAEFIAGRTGYGAGTRDTADRPNVLRVFEVDVAPSDDETLWVLQADLDDLPAEYAAAAVNGILVAGAVDAVIVALTMKKGRPGARIDVLVPANRLAEVERAVFLATSTLGVRRWPVQRTTLERTVEEREWQGQPIRWKRAQLPDGTFREKPEYEDVVRAAAALGLTPYQVRARLAENLHGPAAPERQPDGGDGV